MNFLPIEKMRHRIQIDKHDSDHAYFNSLLLFGEMLLKTTCIGLVCGIKDGRERSKYGLLYKLVRTDGIGGWKEIIDEILIGPTSQYLDESFYVFRNQLTKRNDKTTWEYGCVELMKKCLGIVYPIDELLESRVQLRTIFSDFVTFRNKTRGHGAIATEVMSRTIPLLDEALNLLANNFSLFQIPWAHLHHNLSGKYRVSPITEDIACFNYLKHSTDETLQSGIYLFLSKPMKLDLLSSDADLSDFYYPNGSFTTNSFENISYISGSIINTPSEEYIHPVSELPESETHGLGTLEVVGNTFSNIPALPEEYIPRLNLEKKLEILLLDDRHPIITLVGRGGIGKTWLTLNVLNTIAIGDAFEAIFWLSARDIDLIQEGAKIVKPRVVTIDDIAKGFISLMNPQEYKGGKKENVNYLAENLNLSPIGPIILAIDNFETVDSPVDVYTWIDTHIRLPNKIIITTRFREFKADYPVEVHGMTSEQSNELISITAKRLGISHLLSKKIEDQIFIESDGHPYIMKIHLGELAKAGKPIKLERVVAKQDKILDALFERTYTRLSPTAQRVFLTLSAWHSSVPQIALEAVLLRQANEAMNVEEAIEELHRCSLIEINQSTNDSMYFISVPLAAELFGRRKLAVSAMKTAIEADCQILQYFGPSQKSDIKHGFEPRLSRLFKYLSSKMEKSPRLADEHLPMLEMIGRNYPIAWLYLSELYEECPSKDCLTKAQTFVRNFLESQPPDDLKSKAWSDLTRLSGRLNDFIGEIHALVEKCEVPGIGIEEVSYTANRINHLFHIGQLTFDTEEKKIIVERLIGIFLKHLNEADANDYSRLAWLCLHLGKTDFALRYASDGLKIDPNNEHCLNLFTKLTN
ncbi:MAG TPA: hypothetical protein ENH40_06240 [Nitrospirae bacterium]|nr:hypothetical protein [Nitrospirota bacterium]